MRRNGLVLVLLPRDPLPREPRLPQGLPAERRHLTPRETEVMLLVADCHQNKEIAARLGTSEGTVKVHLSRVYLKLGLTAVGSPRTALARVVWDADRAAEALPKAA